LLTPSTLGLEAATRGRAAAFRAHALSKSNDIALLIDSQTPTPNPSPQGGGEQSETAARSAASTQTENALARDEMMSIRRIVIARSAATKQSSLQRALNCFAWLAMTVQRKIIMR
jgi:hypothetical protein